ncbi:MAG: acetyl-CoA C-acyltransferase [Planctomycetota bacterium]
MKHKTGRVAIVAGCRTPFVKARTAFEPLGPLALGARAVSGLLQQSEIPSAEIEAVAFGVVVPEPGRPNLAREIVFETGLPMSVEAQTVSSYCITGLRSLTIIADAIARGRIDVGIAGGAESLSRADPNTFREPTTGLSMGEHMELTAKEWKLPRARIDEIALASHQRAVAAQTHLDAEIVEVEGVRRDSGPRATSSLEALAGLKPVFGETGVITAGNASPVTDGAAAVLLMSEERARADGREPLAFIHAMEYGAIDPKQGLLMAPASVVPRLLERSGIALGDIDLIEIHEAFAAQVLANVMAWEQGWGGKPTGTVDWDRVNVNGSSLAIGHPWSATGGRIVTTLAHEMARRDSSWGLVSICAAGAMAGAFLLERS